MPQKRFHTARLTLLGICSAVLLTALGCFSLTLFNNWQVFDNTDIPPSYCKVMDSEAPEIKLNGAAQIAIIAQEGSYEELGATVVDDCGAASLEITGDVDVATIGTYDITYTSVDKSGNVGTAIRTINVVPKSRGTIYLTFDDGPGAYTAELLDVLKKYDVKATFFVTGNGDDNLILREYQEGHAVGLHTFTHNYAYIYQNLDTFFEDLNRVQERVKRIMGNTTKLMRFPGGSSNTVSARYDGKKHIMTQLTAEVEKRGFVYFDWNVSSRDAEGASTAEEVADSVIKTLKEGGSSVVLQHDIKEFSVKAVEQIIKYGITNGYIFDKLDENSFTAHHGVNN